MYVSSSMAIGGDISAWLISGWTGFFFLLQQPRLHASVVRSWLDSENSLALSIVCIVSTRASRHGDVNHLGYIKYLVFNMKLYSLYSGGTKWDLLQYFRSQMRWSHGAVMLTWRLFSLNLAAPRVDFFWSKATREKPIDVTRWLRNFSGALEMKAGFIC